MMTGTGTRQHEEWRQTMEDDRYKEHGAMKVRTIPCESQQCLLGEKNAVFI